MSAHWLRRLLHWHRWSALASGLFALLFCLTGLPLLFADSLAGLDAPAPPGVHLASPLGLDGLVAGAHHAYPGARVRYLGHDGPGWFVTLAGTDGRWRRLDAPADGLRFTADHALGGGWIDTLVDLHARLLSGPIGALVVAAIGGVMLFALASGVAVHLPFVPRDGPLTPRTGRAPRTRRLDRHNLVGVTIALWAIVITGTGSLLALAGPIESHWRATTLRHAAAPVATEAAAVSPAAALAAALAVAPAGRRLGYMAMPGSRYATPHGYVVYLVGTQGIARLIRHPVWVAATGRPRARVLATGAGMRLLAIASPLHVAGIGGPTLRVVWALLDIVLMATIASGLWLWWQRVGRRLGTPARSPRHEPA